jgi:hypothetical protein
MELVTKQKATAGRLLLKSDPDSTNHPQQTHVLPHVSIRLVFCQGIVVSCSSLQGNLSELA